MPCLGAKKLPNERKIYSLERSLKKVWFLRKVYAVVQALQGYSYNRNCHDQNDPSQSLIGEVRYVR